MPLRSERPDLVRRPGEGTPLRDGWCRDRPKPVDLLRYAAMAAGLFEAVNTKLVPSAHIRCRITASLRASATLAFLIPARRASFIAQLLRPEPLAGDRKSVGEGKKVNLRG